MSQRPISRSDDLRRLRDEGYDVTCTSGFLVVGSVPYVSANREVALGRLVCPLDLAGEVATRPDTHVMRFDGAEPCDAAGAPLHRLIHSTGHEELAPGLSVEFTFSQKPDDGYADYFEKVTAYVAILEHEAQAIDHTVTARVFPVVRPDDDEDSVFNYTDTASSRAGTVVATRRFVGLRLAIVGLGGTGSYILDLVAKTPVAEIHLFDRDTFLQHNAFRSPGAASIQELEQRMPKVAYLQQRCELMHKGVIAHPYHLDETNLDELNDFDFVFVAIDDNDAKAPLLRHLDQHGRPFIDVGLGVYETDGQYGGLLRVTTSTPDKRDHISGRIPLTKGVDDEYDTNVQIVDLNALNAALAVLRWKRLIGFYVDLEHEFHSVYTIDGNALDNEDQA
jgi:hypothetical protein